jgi:hypothetical protein
VRGKKSNHGDLLASTVQRFYMELYPTLALHLRVLPLDPHLICVAKG